MKIKKFIWSIVLCCFFVIPLGIAQAEEESQAPEMIMATAMPSKDKKEETTFTSKAALDRYMARQAQDAVKSGDAYLPKLTQIKLKLLAPVSSKKNKAKETVYFKVAEDVVVNDVVVIPQSTEVQGTILKATSNGWFGRSGKLEINIPSINTFNNVAVPLNGYVKGYGVDARDNAMAVGGVVPFGGMFVHGENIYYEQGQLFMVSVKRDTDLLMTPAELKAAGQAVVTGATVQTTVPAGNIQNSVTSIEKK